MDSTYKPSSDEASDRRLSNELLDTHDFVEAVWASVTLVKSLSRPFGVGFCEQSSSENYRVPDTSSSATWRYLAANNYCESDKNCLEKNYENVTSAADGIHIVLENLLPTQTENPLTTEGHQEKISPNDVYSVNDAFRSVEGESSLAKNKSTPQPQRRRRRKNPQPEKWSRNVAKIKRMKGEEYVGYRRKTKGNTNNILHDVPKEGRKMGPTCTSPLCKRSARRLCEKIDDDERKRIFQNFWLNMSWDLKKMYVCCNVEISAPKKSVSTGIKKRESTFSYFLKLTGGEKIPVCQTMFLNTLGLRRPQVRHWLKTYLVRNLPGVKSCQKKNKENPPTSRENDVSVVASTGNKTAQSDAAKNTVSFSLDGSLPTGEEAPPDSGQSVDGRNPSVSGKPSFAENESIHQPERRRRKRIPARNKTKIKRKKGEKDVGYRLKKKGNTNKILHDVPEEGQMGPTCNSPFCQRSEKRLCGQINENERRQIFEDFWKNMSLDSRKLYVCCNVEITAPKRSCSTTQIREYTFLYFLKTVGGRKIPVCQTMFLNTLGLKRSTVRHWLENYRDHSVSTVKNCQNDNEENPSTAGENGVEIVEGNSNKTVQCAAYNPLPLPLEDPLPNEGPSVSVQPFYGEFPIAYGETSFDVNKLISPPQRKRRSRFPDPDKWARNEAKIKRMKGEEYVGYRRKTKGNTNKILHDVPKEGRKMGPTCNSPFCRRSEKRLCAQINENERREIFVDFWSNMSWDLKKMYVCCNVEIVAPKRSYSTKKIREYTFLYFLKTIGGKKIPVCQTMFLNTLGLRRSQVRHWLQNYGDYSVPSLKNCQNDNVADKNLSNDSENGVSIVEGTSNKTVQSTAYDPLSRSLLDPLPTEELHKETQSVSEQPFDGAVPKVSGEPSFDVNKLVPSRQRRSKLAEAEKWLRKEAKLKRINARKANKPLERKMGPTCNLPLCQRSTKRLCRQIDENERQRIFDDFWQNMSWDAKKMYVCSNVEISAPKRSFSPTIKKEYSFSYFLKTVGGQKIPVCQTMFLNTIGMKRSRVRYWLESHRVRNLPPAKNSQNDHEGEENPSTENPSTDGEDGVRISYKLLVRENGI